MFNVVGARTHACDPIITPIMHNNNNNNHDHLHRCTTPVCKILKEKGGDVNIKEQRNQVTPLHWAAREGKLNVLEFLLENGADINFQDKDGYSALHYAALNGHTDVVRHLVKEGANVNAVDNQLRTPLHRACEKNRFDCVKILVVDGKADVNKQNRHGWTALHYASYANYSNICVYLLNRGASQELKDSEGRKPLFWGYGYFDQFEESEAEKQGH
eukprot:GEZU01021028.1.p1 GENE.GEZU01021028.1~~GEZU01021028.1.p1  ORF type:complete len:215 (-),score=56.31 GEZU01021028.1:20-664(-)